MEPEVQAGVHGHADALHGHAWCSLWRDVPALLRQRALRGPRRAEREVHFRTPGFWQHHELRDAPAARPAQPTDRARYQDGLRRTEPRAMVRPAHVRPAFLPAEPV